MTKYFVGQKWISLQQYREFSPTAFDAKGLNGDYLDRSHWYVAPVSQNRDSGCLDRSNFRCTLAALGGESDTVEGHRFGHWGPGWYEIILIDPADSTRVQIAQEISDALADYPIVDESDYSELEWNEAADYWQRMSVRERVQYLQRADQCIFAARRDELPEDPNGRLFEYLTRE